MGGLKTRPYGNTGDEVTVIGLGGACLYKHSFNEGVATVRRALELGVTYFDTSPFYQHGMSQAILGEALDGRAEKYLLATKIGHLAAPKRFRSHDSLRAQLDENLRLLRRDSVDTLQVHESDRHPWWTDAPPRERGAGLGPDYDFEGAPVMEVLREAKAEGLCRFIGITGNGFQDVGRVLRNVNVDICLPAFNYDILRRGAPREVFPIAKAKGVTVVLGGIFHNGREADVHREWLTSPPSWMTPKLRDRMERLYAVQRECGRSLAELTIRFLLADRDFSSILVGAATPDEIEQSVAAGKKGPLPQDLHETLQELGLP